MEAVVISHLSVYHLINIKKKEIINAGNLHKAPYYWCSRSNIKQFVSRSYILELWKWVWRFFHNNRTSTLRPQTQSALQWAKTKILDYLWGLLNSQDYTFFPQLFPVSSFMELFFLKKICHYWERHLDASGTIRKQQSMRQPWKRQK